MVVIPSLSIKLLGIESIARLEAAVVGIALYERFAEGAVVEVLVGAAGFVGDVFSVAFVTAFNPPFPNSFTSLRFVSHRGDYEAVLFLNAANIIIPLLGTVLNFLSYPKFYPISSLPS